MAEYVKHTGGSIAGKSKKSYDAMVYKDADSGYTIAVDGNGNVIKKVLSSANTDDIVIQAAINILSSGNIFISSGTFYLSTNVTVNSNIDFSGAGIKNTKFYSNSTTNRCLCAVDSSNVRFKDFSIMDYVTLGCYSLSLDVENVTMQNIYATGKCQQVRFYLNNVSSSTMSNILISDCIAENTGWGFAVNSDVINKLIKNVTFNNCKAINCGKYSPNRYSLYDVGFSLESAATYNVSFISCLAEGCLESGFHQEYAPTRKNVRYIGCISKDNGQKTKLSNTIVDREDITKTTPFVCTNIGPTHSEVSKIRVRIISNLDTITNFSVRIQGLTAGDVPIDEIITESTPGVVNEINGWSFYTTNTFKANYYSTTTTVQSVTGASSGDTISVGQDGTYVSGFLATNCTLIGCESEDDIRSLYGGGGVSIIGHKSINSTYPYYNDSCRVVGFIEKWSAGSIQNATVIRVGNGYEYTNLSSALSSITDASPSKVYQIELMGDVTDVVQISWKSYVNLCGNGFTWTINTNSISYGVFFENLSSVLFDNVTVIRSGTSSGSSYGIAIGGTTNNTVIFNNVIVRNQSTAVSHNIGMYVLGTSSPIIRNCSAWCGYCSPGGTVSGIMCQSTGSPEFISCNGYGNTTSSVCYGINISGYGSSTSGFIKLINCNGVGGSGGSDCCGIVITGYFDKSTPLVIGCTGIGGSGGTSCHGIYVTATSQFLMIGCVGIGGTGGIASSGMCLSTASCPSISSSKFIGGVKATGYGLYIILGASPVISDCEINFPTFSSTHSFTGSNNTILPISGDPYFIYSIRVGITTAGAPSSTLNIGTTPGGIEIASGIPTDSVGSKYFTFNRSAIVADSPIYLSFSDTSTRANIPYVIGYNNLTCRALYIDTYGYARISNCKFYSNQSSSSGYITTTSRTSGKFIIENCSFESIGTYDLEGQTAGLVPVYNCTFGRGSLLNITLPGQGTGATITAGNTYVDVTHGLNNTPTKVRVTPTTNLGTRSFWVDTKGASTFRININSSDVINHTFDWEAEV